jgi:hypothetical protein
MSGWLKEGKELAESKKRKSRGKRIVRPIKKGTA